ncbi:MAG: DUF2206 domain-containing protein [Chloroflexi bacterium]|nr:DUF2206 domain-containing protein [Chloroflexota bacterium]
MTAFNDWPIKKCLVLSVSLLLATLGLIGLAALGLDIPILRQIVGFALLTFVPGILLLRILRIHNISIIESLLYSVGLSLAFVMAVGTLANFALPPLGIKHPISVGPLVVSFTVFLLILCAFAYLRDKDFHLTSIPADANKKESKVGFGKNLNPYLLAILLPLLAILGTSMANAYQSNLLLLILIVIVAIIIGVVAFNKVIPPQAYPFTIVMMALALLYQTTLVSNYLVGSDIHLEYYFAWVVAQNGFWNAAVAVPVNACLSIVMLAPVYSLLLNIDIVWLFKIVYPVFFALMPLALFRMLRLQIRPQYAFLATAFFITMPMFTMDMVQLARQQVSELFFVLVILLMVDRKLTLVQRTALVLIFGFGVIVSHYGMGTGYAIGYLTFGVLVLIFIKSRFGRAIWQWLIGKSNSLPADLAAPGAFSRKALATIVCLSLVFMFGYYGVVASGTSLLGTQIVINTAKAVSEPLTQYISPPRETEAPPAPNLISPAANSGIVNLTPRLEWAASPWATSYWLQVSSDANFTELVIDKAGITDTHYDVTAELEQKTVYFWRVDASNAYGISEWSQCWYFVTWVPTLSQAAITELPGIELPGFVQNLTTRFPMLNPLAREPLVQTALGLDFIWASPGGKVWRIFQYLVQLCLIIGFIRFIFRPGTLGQFKAEYLSLTIVSIAILLGIFLLPTHSYGLGVTRIWQITLLLICPLFIFGGEAVAQGIAKLVGVFRKSCVLSRSGHDSLALLRFPILMILIPYFILNSGLVFELSKSKTTYFIDMPYSIALSSHRMDLNTVFVTQDITAATWLSKLKADDCPIYVDYHGMLAFPDYWGDEKALANIVERGTIRMPPFPADLKDMTFPCYIYFRAWNTDNRMLTFPTVYAARQSIGFDAILGLPQLVNDENRIYNNGGAQVLLPYQNEK